MKYDGDGDSVGPRLDELTRDCAHAVTVDGGSVALLSRDGTRVLRSATDPVARQLEEAQISLGEGPYVDAGQSRVPVLVPDLCAVQEPDGQRWPFFAEEAARLDVRAMFAFPIRVSTVAVGTFGLYRRSQGGLASSHLGRAMRTVDEIAATILDGKSGLGSAVSGQDGHRDAPTAQVHQAAGMVMVQADVTILEAMALLRATAFAENLPLPELAREVVERQRRVGKGDPA